VIGQQLTGRLLVLRDGYDPCSAQFGVPRGRYGLNVLVGGWGRGWRVGIA
jgi:hypothetical protein